MLIFSKIKIPQSFMKKLTYKLAAFILLSAMIGGIVGLPVVTEAANVPPNPTNFPPEMTDIDIWGLLAKALNWFANIVLLISAIMIVYAGFTYVTAGGKEDKIKLAMQVLIYALVGFAVALLARFLVNVVTQFIANQTPKWPQ
jgi:hypothetical protein